MAETSTQINKRISEIRTYVGLDGNGIRINAVGNLVKTYRLTYTQGSATQRSVIQQIEERSSEGACLPATQFNYSSAGVSAFVRRVMSDIGGWVNVDSSTAKRYLMIDTNGDVRSDIAEVFKSGNSTNAHIWRNTDNGFTSSANSAIGGWSDVNASNARRYLTAADISGNIDNAPCTSY